VFAGVVAFAVVVAFTCVVGTVCVVVAGVVETADVVVDPVVALVGVDAVDCVVVVPEAEPVVLPVVDGVVEVELDGVIVEVLTVAFLAIVDFAWAEEEEDEVKLF
jgi:hypothetical protein